MPRSHSMGTLCNDDCCLSACLSSALP